MTIIVPNATRRLRSHPHLQKAFFSVLSLDKKHFHASCCIYFKIFIVPQNVGNEVKILPLQNRPPF